EDAAPYYRRALGVRPTDADVRVDLATCLFQLHRGEPALAELDTVLAAAPRHENALYNRGVVLLSLGRSDEADKAAGLYLGAHPDAPHAAEVRTRLGAKGHGFGAAAAEKKKTYP